MTAFQDMRSIILSVNSAVHEDVNSKALNSETA